MQVTKSVVALSLLAYGATAKNCKALVLSGGGANGAWETGVLWGLLHYGNPDDFDYDVVTGVSAGSINAIALAGFTPAETLEASEWLSDLWQNLTTDNVWVDWPLGKLEGLLTEPGIVDNSPLLEFLNTNVLAKKQDYGRKITVAAVNVDDGEYTEFDQNSLDFSDLPKAAVASASIPAVFPAFQWENVGIFMDGGTAFNVNADSAISQCTDIVGDDLSKIIVDVMICGSYAAPEEESKTSNTIGNYFRSRDLKNYYDATDSLTYTMRAYPDVKFRYTFSQGEGLSGLAEINFSNDVTWPL